MEVTQFTYFQQVGGLDCRPVTSEITYGLRTDRDVPAGVASVYDLWRRPSAGHCSDVFHQNEVEMSRYNFEAADTAVLVRASTMRKPPATRRRRPDIAGLRAGGEASHTFNLLDARRAISVMSGNATSCASGKWPAASRKYYDSRAALGFPMLASEPASGRARN